MGRWNRTAAGTAMAMMIVAAAGRQAAVGEMTVRVADVTKLKGQSVNKLVGLGLVVVLNGTGDGDRYEATMRALAQTLGNLSAPVAGLEELKDTKNVALVHMDAMVPEHGVREGDRIDVHVSAMGSAKDLTGGRLLVSPLVYHELNVERVFAYASGVVETEDAERPTTGQVRGGALVNEDVLVGFTAFGRELPFGNEWIKGEEVYITIVLDDSHAGWGLAVAIAEAINAELSLAADVERVAMAADPKSVVVWVPPFQRSDAGSWIRDIEELSVLMPPEEARVVVNRKTGTIAVSGNARISPVVVSQKGMTVVVRVPPAGPDDARLETKDFVSLETGGGGDANVTALLTALNQLNVPIGDRIAVLTEIQRAGKLHGKLMFEE